MRKDHGWYPSFLEPKDVAPRDAPAYWLFKRGAKTACGIPASLPGREDRCIDVKVGDVVPFDYWHAVGTAIVGIGADGTPWVSEGEEPAEYDSVWNPRDTEAREWPTLAKFMAAWDVERLEWAERFRVEQGASDAPEPYTTVGVEFIAWERKKPFRIAAGPKAVEVTT